MKQSFEHRDDALYTFHQNKIKGRQLLLKTIYSCRGELCFSSAFCFIIIINEFFSLSNVGMSSWRSLGMKNHMEFGVIMTHEFVFPPHRSTAHSMHATPSTPTKTVVAFKSQPLNPRSPQKPILHMATLIPQIHTISSNTYIDYWAKLTNSFTTVTTHKVCYQKENMNKIVPRATPKGPREPDPRVKRGLKGARQYT